MSQLKRNLTGDYELIGDGATRNLGNLDAAAKRGSTQDLANVKYATEKFGYTPPAGVGGGQNAGATPLPTTGTNPMEASDNPADIFNLLMVDSLKKAQGVNTADLYKKKRELERAALSGQQELTPEELRTLSPAQQAALRSGKVAPLQPEFDEIAYQIKKAEGAIANYESTFQNVMKISGDFAEKMVAPENVIANYKQLIEADPDKINTYLANVNDKTKEAILGSLDYTKMKPNEDKELVLGMISSFPDAGISTSDTLEVAQSKLKNSRIYQDKVRPPVRSGGGSTPKQTDEQKVISAQEKDITKMKESLIQNKTSWAEAYNIISVRYPELSRPLTEQDYLDAEELGLRVEEGDETLLDLLLDKEQFYGVS